jgi:serine protease Do
VSLRLANFLSMTLACAAAPVIALPLHDIAKVASPSVVHLSIRDSSNEEDSSGSGFVISADGQVATNFHVVDEAERMVAVFPDGRQVDVVGIRAFDKEDDVAVLQLAPGSYPPLRLSETPAAPGDDIIVIGSPLGLGHSLSTGIIAATREHGTVTKGHKDGDESWQLQITAAIAPGSSGSPILNDSGDVVGLAVGRMGDDVYFGIPIAKLKTVVEKMPAQARPLGEAPHGRSVRTNLLISGALFSGIAAAYWGSAWLQRRRRRQVARTGWPRV